MIRQWTTRTQVFRVVGIDLTNCDVYLTIDKYGKQIIKNPSDLNVELDGEDTLVTVTLTQEESGSLGVGDVVCQINYIDVYNVRDATEEITVAVYPNRLKKVISYVGN